MPEISMNFPMVINGSYGGYGLSRAASEEVARRKGLVTRDVDGALFVGDSWNAVGDVVPRNDPELVAVVREMGALAGRDLKVVEVSVCVEIDSYDGMESVRVGGGVFG